VQLGDTLFVYTTVTDELKTDNVVFIDAVLVLFATLGLSKVTWTLQELEDGKVNLHLEQTGLSNEEALGGAKYGWSKWCGELEKVVA
jgi:Activator of Hsp90 ATPase homolog 1-like protein.